jgi:hypothetical protein
MYLYIYENRKYPLYVLLVLHFFRIEDSFYFIYLYMYIYTCIYIYIYICIYICIYIYIVVVNLVVESSIKI